MNIPPIETILTDLDEARRQRNASNRRIEELTDALETQQRVIKQAHEDIAKLTTERDRFANMISESSNRWHEMMAALREAKEALVMNIVGTGGRTPAAHNAIANINKVLGEE